MSKLEPQQPSNPACTVFRFATLRIGIIGIISLRLFLAPAILAAEARGRAEAVASVRLVLPPKPDAVTENIARVFARQVSQRCGAKVTTSPNFA